MPHVFIIAEAGVNHNGSVDLALKLIDSAKASGADAVKFQTFGPTSSLLALRIRRHIKNGPRRLRNHSLRCCSDWNWMLTITGA